MPATDLVASAVLPCLMLAGIFSVYCLVRCWINPALGPAVPMSERAPSLGPGIKDLLLGVAPVIVIIISTLGVILAGITTPTDAGAVGCFATDAHRHSGADLRVRLAAEPIVQAAGIDLIWFCTLVGVTLKTASSPSRS